MIILQLSAVVSLLTLLIALPRQIHMLQQNAYYNSKYWSWLKGSWNASCSFLALVTAAQLVLVFTRPLSDIPLLCLSALSLLFRLRSNRKKLKQAIKKLVYTARVKRMLGTALLLLTALAVWMFLSKNTGNTKELFVYACVLLGVCPAPLTMLINLLNRPVEKAVANHYVRDARRILAQHSGMKIIGITGSYGKTSTKYILGRILSEKFNVLITPESYNTLMGVVITIRQRLKSGTEVFVVEMGARKPRDIAAICDLTHPTMGIITSVGPQHLDTFGSIERIIETKFELSDEVLRNGGRMFLNHDNPYIRENAPQNGVVFFGTGDGCAYTAQESRYSRDGSAFTICGKGHRIPVTTRLLGNHNVLNILSAAATALELGVSPADLQYAVSRLNPVEHRLEMKPFLNGAVLIDDAYNANPSGSLEAVRVLGSFAGMRKVIVTPGLVELADKEYEHNYNLGLAAGKTCDVVILVGEQRAVPMREAIETLPFNRENLHVVKNFPEAMAILRGIADENTVVLFENDLPDNFLK